MEGDCKCPGDTVEDIQNPDTCICPGDTLAVEDSEVPGTVRLPPISANPGTCSCPEGQVADSLNATICLVSTGKEYKRFEVSSHIFTHFLISYI